MKLIGELKEKVEKAESKEEARRAIEEAGIELTDDELDGIAGGYPYIQCPLPLMPEGKIV